MPMTILQYITPSRLGGAERYFLKLVEELGLRGHRVIVVTKRDTPLRAELETLSATLPEGARPELHFWHTRGKIDPWTLVKLVLLVKRRGVQLINTHLTTASWQGSLAGKMTGTPVVAWVHAADRKTFFQWADYLIAVSDGVEQFLIKQGVPCRKIEQIYCGFNSCDVASVVPIEIGTAKERLGIAPDTLTVGIAASLTRRKGHRFLLEAMQILRSRGLLVDAIFAGEGDQEADLRDRVKRLGLDGHVHFLGFRRDVHQVIAAMDVFALPSFKEGLSIAIMETLAIGRPVVATRITGMNEVIKHGENGLLVPTRDAMALANALELLFSDPKLRQKFAAHGQAFIVSRFEEKHCFNSVENFFERVMQCAVATRDSKTSIHPVSGVVTKSTASTRSDLSLDEHPAAKLQRCHLERHTVATIQAGRGYKSSVYIVEIEGQRAVVKDYAHTPFWFRHLVAPFLIRRETRTLSYLHDFSVAPRLYARIDALAFAMEYIEATPICDLEIGQVQPDVFVNLERAISALHERHVSHCDLKRRRNILVDKRGEIFIIDFAAALIGKQLNPILNWFQQEMVEVDNKALPRAKKLVAPQLLTEHDHYQLSHPTRLERWARRFLGR